MPYKKKQYKRRPGRKGKSKGRMRFKRYGAKAGSVAYSAYRMARKLMDAVNVEYKIFNVTATSASTDYGGTVSILNNPAQGVLDTQRIGDSLKCQNLSFRYIAQRGTLDTSLRCIIYWDPQNQIAAGSDLLENIGSIQSAISPKQYDNRFRSRILYDKVTNLTSNNPWVRYDELIEINEHTQFNAATQNILTGALKVLFISTLVAGATAPFAHWSSRLSFTDN